MFARVYISNCMGHYYMYMYLSEANCMVNIYKTCLLVCMYILCNTHYIGSPQSNIRTAVYIMQRYAENEGSKVNGV